MERSALTSELRDRLLAGLDKPPLDVAVELARCAGAAGLAALAALAIDPRLAVPQRMVVLLAVSIDLALAPGVPAPADALDAVEDEETSTLAIRSGFGAALTGVLAAAPRGGSLDTTRRLLGRRLVAAGERGPHVVQLLLDAGDRPRAAELAADDLAPHLAGEPTLDTWVRLRILLDWDDALLDAVLSRLEPAARATIASRIVDVPDADPAAVQRVRSAVVWLAKRG